MKSLLLIEDDPSVVKAVQLALPPGECCLTVETRGRAGLQRALQENFDLVVVDINLPEVSGFDICRNLRSCKPQLPLLVLTSRTDELDVVLGLEQGADDYIQKPFRAREFGARVRALIRRSGTQSTLSNEEQELNNNTITAGSLVVDARRRRVWVEDKLVHPTLLEFELLMCLVTAGEKVVSRKKLLRQVWGEQAETYDSTLSSHLSRLRMKLGPAGNRLITIRGYGYKFVLFEPQAAS